MYPRNAASPPRLAIGAVVQISDGAVQTSGVSVKVRPEGGTASAGGGTVAYEEGIVLYTPTQAETDYTAFVVIAYKTGCVPVSLAVVTTASATAGKVDVGAFGGTTVTGRDIGASVLLSSGTGTGQISLTSGAVLLQATQTGVTIPTVTNLTNLPSIPNNWITAAGIASGALTSAKFAAGAFDAVWSVATRVLTAATNLTTALATPTNITAGTITTVSGNVTGSVGSVASGGITAASFAADALARLGIVAYGTAQAATGTTLQLASASTFADDELIGAVLVITGGSAGVGQSRVITDNVGSTDTVTVDAWTTTPTGTVTYVIFAAPPASATALPAVNVTHFGGSAGAFASGRPEVNTTHLAGTSQTGRDIGASVLLSPGTGTGQVSLTSGKVSPADGSIGSATFAAGAITAAAIATGAVDADALATDAVTEIASGVLSAAATTPIDANIQKINDVTIVGNGSSTPFDV